MVIKATIIKVSFAEMCVNVFFVQWDVLKNSAL